MNKQTAINQNALDQAGRNQMDSEYWEVDHLCHRYGLSRTSARNIVESYSGDRVRMEHEAERLAKYEKLH
jgi:hypothetical protein